MKKHTPVLIDEVLKTLGNIQGKTIVDCTFGAGGYSRAFLDAGADVISFDRDPSVVADADKLSKEYPNNFKFLLAPFSKISQMVCVKPDAVVFDLGISSMQIDIPERGFSFRYNAPLDMRMESVGVTAAQLIENISIDELAKILREYGDIKKASLLANVIKKSLPKTTFELRDLIYNPKDVAPVFQALRIAVNDEVGEIKRALIDVRELLSVGGCCICVTFHSLEDGLIKSIFREWSSVAGDPRMPTIAEPPRFKTLKVFRPTLSEISENPRARSAHLRAVVKSY